MTDDRLRIALLMGGAGTGGMERHVFDLARGLRGGGHDVVLLVSNAMQAMVPADIPSRPAPLDANRRNPLALWKMRRILRDGQFDIVHAQGSKAAQMLAVLRPFLPVGMLAVGTLHNQKRTVSAFRRLDMAIAVSKALAADINHANTTVIYHGLKGFDGIAPVDLPPSSRPQIAAVARLVAAKGFDRLIAAWSGMDADLMIFGDGPEHDHLASLIGQLGLTDRVRLMGATDNVPGYLKAVDGLIVPSRREGFSYVVAEALLCHCPVLATDVPVANEVLDPALILPGDPAEMAVRIAQYLGDLAGWRAACEPAFAYADAQFVLPRMIDDTVALYRRGLAARRA